MQQLIDNYAAEGSVRIVQETLHCCAMMQHVIKQRDALHAAAMTAANIHIVSHDVCHTIWSLLV